MAATSGAEEIKFAGVVRCDEHGGRHLTMFAEMAQTMSRVSAVATAVLVGAGGKPLPAPDPTPSVAQQWAAIAADDDDVGDMLAYVSRKDSWFDIYKAFELAERIVGGQARLRKMLGASLKEYEKARGTANFYRHARAYRPPLLATLGEARAALGAAVKLAMAHCSRTLP